MDERKKRLMERNERIRKEYLDIYKRGYRHDYIIDELIKKYFLSRDTLERIMYKTGTYKNM